MLTIPSREGNLAFDFATRPNTGMKFKIHQLLGLLCSLALTVTAQQSRPAQSITPDTTQLKKHVKYLAADELEGRRPGTPGGDKAAAYLAEQFHQLKLGCASPDRKCRHQGKKHSGYLQEFPFIAAVELAQRNNLNITRSGNTTGVTLRGEWSRIGFSQTAAQRRRWFSSVTASQRQT